MALRPKSSKHRTFQMGSPSAVRIEAGARGLPAASSLSGVSSFKFRTFLKAAWPGGQHDGGPGRRIFTDQFGDPAGCCPWMPWRGARGLSLGSLASYRRGCCSGRRSKLYSGALFGVLCRGSLRGSRRGGVVWASLWSQKRSPRRPSVASKLRFADVFDFPPAQVVKPR
jgi:hypothetical protein